jgi:hypothetical protein
MKTLDQTLERLRALRTKHPADRGVTVTPEALEESIQALLAKSKATRFSEKTLEREPTKLTEPGFVSSVASSPGGFPENYADADQAFGRPDPDERAAIAEIDGGLPRDWAEALGEIEHAPPPPLSDAREWRQALDAALHFADAHGVRAHALGWTFADLFALDPETPLIRTDGRGRALLLHGVDVLEITPDFILVQTPTGATQRLFKPSRS